MKDYKLSIELVPKTVWYKNLRNMVKRSVWDNLRRGAYAKYGYRCGICGASKQQLNCHEIWDYDDETHIQTLTGFIALCNLCHHQYLRQLSGETIKLANANAAKRG